MSDSYLCTYEVDATETGVTGYSHTGEKSWQFMMVDLRADGYEAMEDYTAFLRDLGYKPRSSVGPFGSGAVLQVFGDKVVGRTEPKPAECIEDLLAYAHALATAVPTEPQRAPLPNSDAWRYTGKERDDFPEFVVTRETVIDFALPLNKPLPKGGTLHAHPGVGSALLRG